MKPFYKSIFFIFSFLLFCFSSQTGQASLQIPDKALAYVNDYAGLLNAGEKLELEQRLKSFEDETSNQVLLVTFPSLEGDNIEDVSMRLAEKWKVGQKSRDNGVILLISKNDRKLRIEVGYGLEGVLTDATSRSIISNEITPAFKKGDYWTGISSGISAIFLATKGEYDAIPRSENTSKTSDVLTFLGILLLIFLLPILGGRRGNRGITFGSSGWSGGGSSWGGGGGGFSSGGGSFGGGGSSGSW